MISHKTYMDILSYFEAKEKPTRQEKDFARQLKLYSDTFVVSCVTREDIEGRGFDTSNVSDETIERIADKMGENLCETGAYWDALDCYGAEYL